MGGFVSLSAASGASRTTIDSWANCEHISEAKERDILDAIDRAGWRFYGGGVMPKRRY